MAKQKLTPDVVVRIEKSGNRFNAWDTDGNKRTSEITSGCRKNAYNVVIYWVGFLPILTLVSRGGNGKVKSPLLNHKYLQSMFLPTTLKFLILYTILTH